MPRPILPPTPASSTDIKGKDGPLSLGSLQSAFELPPPAMTHPESRASSISAISSSASSYHPTSPKSPVTERKPVAPVSRRKSTTEKEKGAANTSKDAFSLPPPPMRSRKIIQMKPRKQTQADEKAIPGDESVDATKKTPTGKRKQPSATSVAGRKIARKTAHSLIERRRRSKMNEEFGVLKNMIPACTGEMHKLAILQASIDYIRYLEDCVASLKAQTSHRTPTPDDQHGQSNLKMPPPPSARESYNSYEDEDEEMDSDTALSPTHTSQPQSHSQFHHHSSHQTFSHTHTPTFSTTPVLHSQDSSSSAYPDYDRQRNGSYSSASVSASASAPHSRDGRDTRYYSYSGSASASATTSPNFEAMSSMMMTRDGQSASGQYEYAISNASGLGSALTSPALGPLRGESGRDRDMDQEATAALLMLNSDRRANGGGRGLSVKDLLSA